MKKVIVLVAVLALIGAVAFFVKKNSISECDQMYVDYKTFVSSADDNRYVNNSLYRWEVNEGLRRKQSDLGFSCMDTKPEISIMAFESLIDSMNGPQFVLGKKVRRSSAQVSLVASYYNMLASVYDQKGDLKLKDSALKNKAKFEKEASVLKSRGQ